MIHFQRQRCGVDMRAINVHSPLMGEQEAKTPSVNQKEKKKHHKGGERGKKKSTLKLFSLNQS